jgi:PAS domain-containing protein
MITYFTLMLFAASLTALYAGTYAWRRRDVSGGLALALMLLSIAVWCFFSGMETTSTTEPQRYFWSAVSYLGLCNVAPFLLVFALQYSEAAWPLGPWMLAIFWSIPLVTIVLAFTNGAHHLIWTGITPGPVAGTNTVIYHHGIWYLIEMLWFLALSVAASFHLLRVALRAVRIYAAQAAILMACIAFPWIGLLLFVLPSGPVPGLDTTSLGFALSAGLMVTAFTRLRFLDLVPKARSTLIERMQDGFLVLDRQDRVIDVNATAARLLGIDRLAIGKNLADAAPALGSLRGQHPGPEIMTLSPLSDAAMTLEATVTPLAGRGGKPAGRVLLVRDITERRRAEQEREKLIADLSDALADVKKLSGLLPICASCKKIRDDQGYWHQVENYMEDRSEVEFSHGLCPECMARLYPDLQEQPRGDGA